MQRIRAEVGTVVRAELEHERQVAEPPRRAELDDLAAALTRVAEALDGLATRVDAEREERAHHVELIEFMMRELLLANVLNASEPGRPAVLGGSIDPSDVAAQHAPPPLAVGMRIEVRSRFRDTWIGGFRLAEILDRPEGQPALRISRDSDNSVLPVLFGDHDVRPDESVVDLSEPLPLTGTKLTSP
jgi:hypothetical protein